MVIIKQSCKLETMPFFAIDVTSQKQKKRRDFEWEMKQLEGTEWQKGERGTQMADKVCTSAYKMGAQLIRNFRGRMITGRLCYYKKNEPFCTCSLTLD